MATEINKIPPPTAQIAEPQTGICDQYWYDYLAAIGRKTETIDPAKPPEPTPVPDDHVVSFFDFVPEELIPSVIDGTNTTDLGTHWQAFRDALAAMPTPGGFIPACTIKTSVSPNFAIKNLQLLTGGDVLIISTVSGPGSYGFQVDGDTGVGFLTPTLRYVSGVRIGRLRVQASLAEAAFHTKNLVSCEFEFTCSGAVTYGILIENTVSNIYRRPLVKFPMTPDPFYGIYVTGPDTGANNTFETMNIDSCHHGVYLDRAILNTFIGGTSESNSLTNMWITVNSRFNRVYGVDFEGAPFITDVHVYGGGNEFFGCNLATGFLFETGGANNNIFGGVMTSVHFKYGANNNYASGVVLGDRNGYIDEGQFNTAVGLNSTGLFRQAGNWLQSVIPVGPNPFNYLNFTGNNQIVHVSGPGNLAAMSLLRGNGPAVQIAINETEGFGSALVAPADILIVFYDPPTPVPVMTVFPV